jgi:glucokinase
LLGRYEAATGVALPGVKELAGLAATDTVAAALFTDFGESLGQFLGLWMKGFDAEILVIGGNISHAYSLFGPALENSFLQQQLQARVSVAQYQKLLPAIAHM